MMDDNNFVFMDVLEEALEEVNEIIELTDPDEVCGRLQKLAQHSTLTMPAMLVLYFKSKGLDIVPTMNGVEFANTK